VINVSKSRVGPPLVIGHRGACGYRPELTRASFELAIELGADAIETDLVPTRDGILVCRHDAELSLTTDVANHARFANRRTTRLIDGKPESGWFVDDFMWEEIQALRAVERWPFRDHSFDGEFPILGLTELLALIRKHSASLTVLLELKHPAYFASAGLPIEDLLLRELHAAQADAADSPVIVESRAFTTSINSID
jgi:glycerophosphoryl diester phosphodiesterase